MIEDYYLSKMKELDADGIDFIPISNALSNRDYQFCKVIASYTKEEWIKGVGAIPKTPYLFWKVVNGKKEYLR
ncbi:hypothetical protein [Lacrimispora sp.]|uniref:hypothetical protein n=1 Tax=Lacrimispora sp. TaxID=2719234 RepID=UPI0028AADA21|nr:hypothetical protein [Lacrimispora sp.]